MFTSTPETQMETTTYDYDYGSLTYPEPISTIDSLGSQLSILYYFMFLFSLFGNGLVLVIIYQFEKLTTVTNILLLNMVVSSLIFMSSLPFEALYNQLSKWIFGDVMCRIVGSVYYLGFYSSVLFLTLLTFDRHLAVVYSLNAARVRNQRYAVISCAAIWVISSLACIRPMILYKTFKYMNTTLCQQFPLDVDSLNMEMLRTSGFYIQLLLFLIFPLSVIIYCYVRIAISVISTKIITKFKTVRLIFFIVLFFFSCWTPYNIVWLMYDQADADGETADIIYSYLEITRTIAYFYFCISPIFYTFVGKKFQNHFKQLLVRRFPGLKRHVSVSLHSRSNVSTKSTRNEV
ncbi:C-C chemokine receptor type 1-like [Gymnodraco acuticeps]|uniref:C-C chemokine receptor type 1-like n=1 Tax=Gymnodraco acuticeps TaxID=8218 RepID=A0A6P8X337_GYMAC|nr:C-C chemokine receptor type 1-like [Gymnodraco acuticeps]